MYVFGFGLTLATLVLITELIVDVYKKREFAEMKTYLKGTTEQQESMTT